MGGKAPLLMLLILTISGCANRSVESVRDGGSVPLSNQAAVTTELYSQYAEWGGTRYRLGGTDKQGIDCSGFTSVTFMTRFGIHLPRTTAQQVRLGANVPWHNLQPGDLVFFRTSFKDRHVGIYAGNRQFLHASTSRGVMLSSLDNPYWQGKFWKARRIRV
jgi:cell wall-associated NlpC family hydrolase